MQNAKAVILAHTPEPERICASSARISSTKGSATEIYKNTTKDNIGSLISNVVGIGHVTITEHAMFNIALENVSAVFEEFIIEFRLASFTIKSRRYVDYSEMGCLAFEPRFKVEISGKKTDNDIAWAKEQIETHSKALFSAYNDLLSKGIEKEDARFLLPYNFRSHIYLTVNARELLHIIYSAVYGRGAVYPEIKQIGEQLLEQAASILPDVFSNLQAVETGEEKKEALIKAIPSLTGIEKREAGSLTELLTYTKDAEKKVASTAIIQHTGCSTEDALRFSEDESVAKEIFSILTTQRRNREFEQANFTFRINGISLAGLTHLVRHRIQSICIPSFTVIGKSKSVILPESIKESDACLSIYNAACEKSAHIYEALQKAGIIDEDLAYLNLSGNLVDIVTTMNGRQLFHFFKLRTCTRAQWEIRAIAIDMLKQVKKVAPMMFKPSGPSCFTDGKCPEGRMSCGLQKEMNQFFSDL